MERDRLAVGFIIVILTTIGIVLLANNADFGPRTEHPSLVVESYEQHDSVLELVVTFRLVDSGTLNQAKIMNIDEPVVLSSLDLTIGVVEDQVYQETLEFAITLEEGPYLLEFVISTTEGDISLNNDFVIEQTG